jgi:dolichol-phosphate mannosyltransferase
MNYRDIRLGIVCPMANERENAELFVREIITTCARFNFKWMKMFLVFDRKSTDGTIDIMRHLSVTEPLVQVIFAPDNRNVVDAYVRGYREALAASSDWILEIDAGFSHLPSDIPALLQKMLQGYDCVFGSRFCKGGCMTDSPMTRYLISWGGSVLANLLLGTKLHDMTSGFELFRREALDSILARGIQSRGPFFQTEIKTYARKLNIVEVPIQYRAPSHMVGKDAINDAFRGLGRLFVLRCSGKL